MKTITLDIRPLRRALCAALLLAPALLAAQQQPVPAAQAAPAPQQVNYTATAGAAAKSTPLPVANRVVVYKSARRMDLMRGDEVLRSYRIALGLVPVGHKEQVGDFRTPEGHYTLTWRNARSDYFLSIQVSYPSPEDVERAQKAGVDPGGAIMIHGLPNRMRREARYYQERDWTDGCIAVSNSDMVEIWLLTQDNMPIDILP
ncbi:MAG: L,D-transpeptidase family protein [Nevskiaceae bacterium]|nr:L,D-transpeptidase family protein [Nevskiaceae bacterium]